MDPLHLVELLKALGEPTRLSLVLLLAGGEKGGSALLGDSGISQPSLSRHLKVLRESGAIRERRTGRTCFYRLSSSDLVDLVVRLGGGSAGLPGRDAPSGRPVAENMSEDTSGDADRERRDASIEEWLL